MFVILDKMANSHKFYNFLLLQLFFYHYFIIIIYFIIIYFIIYKNIVWKYWLQRFFNFNKITSDRVIEIHHT